MPRISKLASTKLNVGGGSSPLRASGFTNRASGRIRAPGINIHAADVRNTPMPVPKIQQTTAAAALAAGASFAEVTQNAAFKFQERKDRVTADDVVMNYRSELRNSLKGSTDEDGNFRKGYGSLEGQDALDGFQGHIDGVNGGFDSRISQLSPRVQQLVSVRMNQDRNNALTRATSHNVNQVRVVEQQGRYEKLNDAKKNIDAYKAVSWTTGELNELFADYPTLAEQHQAALQLGTYTVQQEYNRTLVSTKDPLQAYTAAEAAMKHIAPHLGEDGEQKLDYWLIQKKAHADTEAKRQAKENQKEYQNKVEFEAPSDFANSMIGNTTEFIHSLVPGIRDNYGTQQEGEDGVVKIMTESFDKIMQKSSMITVQEKTAEISAYLESLTAGEGSKTFTSAELYRITQYAQSDLPKQITDQQISKDRISLAALSSALNQSATDGKPFQRIDFLPGMTSKNRELFKTVQTNAAREKANDGASEGTIQTRTQMKSYYDGTLSHRSLNAAELDDLDNQLYYGQVSWDTYSKTINANNIMKNPSNKKAIYKEDPGYLATVSSIKGLIKDGGYTRTDKPSNDPESTENAQWVWENKLAGMTAIADMNKQARAAAMKGQAFDHNTWWLNHVQYTVNKGRIAKPPTKTLLDAAKYVGSGQWTLATRRKVVGFTHGISDARDFNEKPEPFTKGANVFTTQPPRPIAPTYGVE